MKEEQTHKKRLYNALKSECEAEINEALLTLDMCFTKGTAIGEHTSKHFLAMFGEMH